VEKVVSRNFRGKKLIRTKLCGKKSQKFETEKNSGNP
jgi:hypothetical protein